MTCAAHLCSDISFKLNFRMKLTIFMRSQNHFDKFQKKTDLNYCFILEPNKINFIYTVRAQDVFELRLIKTNKSVSINACNARVDQFLLFPHYIPFCMNTMILLQRELSSFIVEVTNSLW